MERPDGSGTKRKGDNFPCTIASCSMHRMCSRCRKFSAPDKQLMHSSFLMAQIYSGKYSVALLSLAHYRWTVPEYTMPLSARA
jgi:hypothetical protein